MSRRKPWQARRSGREFRRIGARKSDRPPPMAARPESPEAEKRMSKTVYVVDAWNDTTQTSVILVFASREKAQRALDRVIKRPGNWYAGIVKRTVH